MVSHCCILLVSRSPSPPPLPPASPRRPAADRDLLSHDPRSCGLHCRGHGHPTGVVAMWCR
ncbi:hypothetical protein CP966_02690 [Streptomyces galilaeus]|nr:hypothetical protein CP966_02690 [Streptomyces galilaeus]